ncbi:DNA cytosine methyltransferase [Nonomuraea sp. NPDC050153]|uniref:DNA cytosine methyltransferase n=1 Tax=Nonomuraea sp. NPDC050153 TaxID=3364359 RepID=UPI0037A25695
MTAQAIDLFAGCGGLSTGLLDAGIAVKAGFDNNAASITAFDYNHVYRGCKGFVSDLAKVASPILLEMAGITHQVDLLAGGPPCQPFSIAGKQLGMDDHRGELVFKFVDIVGEIRPTAFFFENVPNLARFDDGLVAEKLQSDLAALGYEVTADIINAANYGVPQGRRRFIIVGVPKGSKFEFPEPTHGEAADLFSELKPYVTTSEAIGDLPDVTDPAAVDVPNHEPTMHGEKMLAAFRELKPGTRDKKYFHDRLHPDRVGYTLRAGSGNFSPLRPVHYKYDRVITVRESARLQGFSDKFIWPDPLPRLQQYRQVGNAVPPPLAEAIGRQIATCLGWETKPEELAGLAETRPPAFFMTAEERHALRMERMRGASLGLS